MSLKLRGPDGHQKLVVHTDQVLGSSVGGKVVKAKLDKYPCLLSSSIGHITTTLMWNKSARTGETYIIQILSSFWVGC